nr:immunoglobulin light chain junction region [Macaca mulatta]MOV61095.1 immunoglobulin light chain junction region [Macaca mulatta]MOW74960.1 immunoglobulin light chain junction region [Macaca mulatta]
CQHYNSLPWTF